MHYPKDSQRTKMVFRALALSYVTLVISATDKVHCETYFLMARCEAAHEGPLTYPSKLPNISQSSAKSEESKVPALG